MVVVDRLSKKKKFVPLPDIRTETVVTAFFHWIWREEGFPNTIVSDRGSQFVSHFWKRLCQRIGAQPHLSTAFHPESDGQIEIANSSLKQFLRSYVNYNQDDWVEFLPSAEFETNSAVNESTRLSPFEATKGYVPKAGFEPPAPIAHRLPHKHKTDAQKADALVKRVLSMQAELKEQLKWSQALMKLHADKTRLPAPMMREGDLVMVDARFIKTQRPNQSLDHKNEGPFCVKRIINDHSYELELPETMKVFPVFYP